MNREEISEVIQRMISQELDLPLKEISGESALMDDLEMTSLEVLQMSAEIEKVFKIRIPDHELRKVITIDDLILLIQHITGKV